MLDVDFLYVDSTCGVEVRHGLVFVDATAMRDSKQHVTIDRSGSCKVYVELGYIHRVPMDLWFIITGPD